MRNKRIVISGSPGAGKTSIIKGFKNKGYSIFEEYSRALINEGKARGKDNFFLSDPIKFSERLFLGRKAQFDAAPSLYFEASKPFIFFDRGIQDIYAYLIAINQGNEDWKKRITPFKYDLVFLVEPWEAIYQKDAQRLETFEQAQMYFPFIEKVYAQTHIVVIVPKDTIINRVLFIENYIKLHG